MIEEDQAIAPRILDDRAAADCDFEGRHQHCATCLYEALCRRVSGGDGQIRLKFTSLRLDHKFGARVRQLQASRGASAPQEWLAECVAIEGQAVLQVGHRYL